MDRGRGLRTAGRRNHTQLHLGHGEGGISRSQTQVAQQRNLHPRTYAMTMDGTYHGNRQLQETAPHIPLPAHLPSYCLRGGKFRTQ